MHQICFCLFFHDSLCIQYSKAWNWTFTIVIVPKEVFRALLHINTGNALRSFDVAVCSHSFNLYLFQNKNNTLLGHQHRETVTFPLIASCSFIVACYLGTTVAQNSGWATQLLQTSSVREKQHFYLPLLALFIVLHLSAASLITSRAEQQGESPPRSLCTLLFSWRGVRWEREGWCIECPHTPSPSLGRSTACFRRRVFWHSSPTRKLNPSLSSTPRC